MPLTNPDYVVTKQRLADFYQGILPYLGAPEVIRPTVYGIHITNSESDPDAKVQYIADAVNMTPAHMDFTNDVFDYGSWSNAFFMPKPCMLKYDGTVDYYLDPNDYTKKLDGTASDVANTSYEGNAMMEWPKIWLKIVPEAPGTSVSIYISDENADGMFTDWNYHNASGQSKDHFYTAIYNGSLISNKMRSISGQAAMTSKTAQQELDYAAANNLTATEIWNVEKKCDIDLINILLILISKTTDSQSAFGEGLTAGGQESSFGDFRTGIHNAKGLFYGTNSGTASTYSNAVKVFGMENWWGAFWRRYTGYVLVNGVHKIKMTYGQEDGSTTNGFNLTGSGYISLDTLSPSGTSGQYISEQYYYSNAIIPNSTTNGSSSTHYCDCLWYNNGITAIAMRGGASTAEKLAGALANRVSSKYDTSGWTLGSALSAKP